MKIFFWIIFFVLAVAVIVFAIANRETVTVSLDPFPVAFAAPLYLVALGAAFIGIVGTGLGVARAGWRARQRARKAEKRAAHAEGELARLRGEAAAPAPPKAIEEHQAPPAAAIDIT